VLKLQEKSGDQGSSQLFVLLGGEFYLLPLLEIGVEGGLEGVDMDEFV
jgi:hypothetical protein